MTDNHCRPSSNQEPAGGGYLVLSVSERAPRRFLPMLSVDLGHVEILLWRPPRPPESYGFYVSPANPWLVFASVFYPQRARVSRSRGFGRRPGHWKMWQLSQGQWSAAVGYLERLDRGCRSGKLRYRATAFNCFHVARQCLAIAGLEASRDTRPLSFFTPPLGWRSFLKSAMSDARFSMMEEELRELVSDKPPRS